jgi:hypothetical protein
VSQNIELTLKESRILITIPRFHDHLRARSTKKPGFELIRTPEPILDPRPKMNIHRSLKVRLTTECSLNHVAPKNGKAKPIETSPVMLNSRRNHPSNSTNELRLIALRQMTLKKEQMISVQLTQSLLQMH